MLPRMASQRMFRHIRRDDSGGRSGKQSSGDRKQVLDSDDTKNSNSESDKDSNSQGKNNGNSNNNNNKNTSGNGSVNGSGGNTNTNTNQAKFFPPRDCLFVNENDGRLHYNGSWTLEADDPTGLRTTTHTTTEAGSQMSVAFSGTSIIVIGIVHQSNTTVPPAAATYSIDAGEPAAFSLPFSTHDIPNQQFFQSRQLTQGAHNLTITVTSNKSPYTLDYLFFCGNGTPPIATASVADSNGAKPDGEEAALWPRKTAIIVGSILGALLVMLLIAFVFVLCSIRKRRTRSAFATSPLREWLSRQTLFTSSESIMRHNPSNLGTSTTCPRDDHTIAPPIPDVEKPLPSEPVIRTFSDFDRHYSFPYPLKIHGRDRPTSSISSGQSSRPTSGVPVSPKLPKTPRDWI